MRDVAELKPSDELSTFLLADRATNAYAIADLEPRYDDFCRWFASRSGPGTIDAVALLYTGLRLPALLTFGSADGVDALLEARALVEALPASFYAHLGAAHLAAFQGRYTIDGLRSMVRMALPRADFRMPADDLSDITHVTHADTAALMSLYRYYPDNFFEPYQLETGFYYGVRGGNDLISVAGVHVVSERYDLGVVGNVVTHPDHRSRGHSRRCTSKLLYSLFQKVSLVTLNVQRDNAAARQVYERLGFVEHMRYLEGPVRRVASQQ